MLGQLLANMLAHTKSALEREKGADDGAKLPDLESLQKCLILGQSINGLTHFGNE